MSSYSRWTPPPRCNNCGKEAGAIMTSTSYSHSHPCCGHACAKRLDHKIKWKMGGPLGVDDDSDDWAEFYHRQTPEGRMEMMRWRIKELEHKAKRIS